MHIGPRPPQLGEILPTLRTGDILTHCFTGFDKRLVAEDGSVLPAVLKACERRVLFDVGHGSLAFDSDVAMGVIDRGFLPDTISTDSHAYSIDSVVDFPSILSTFHGLGLQLRAVIQRATSRPAETIGLPELGRLSEGSPADIALFEVKTGSYEFQDTWGHTFFGKQLLIPRKAITAGTPGI